MGLLSGSNGGISTNYVKYSNCNKDKQRILSAKPIVSFFVNNRCQLNCQHCYVNYEGNDTALTVEEWKRVIDECVTFGSEVFCIAGMEPLLDWEKTKSVLEYLRSKRCENRKIRFGLVTNGLLLDQNIMSCLDQISPDYLDISIDGDEYYHDKIRGYGTYKKLLDLLSKYVSNSRIIDNTFIAFTINALNYNTIRNILQTAMKLGIKNVVLSPYLSDSETNDALYLKDRDIALRVQDLVNGTLITDLDLSHMKIFFKTDCIDNNQLVKELIDKKLVNVRELFIDQYGIVFSQHKLGNNRIYFNYPTIHNHLNQTIRISHDGYLGSCYDMFYSTFRERCKGNVKSDDVKNLLTYVNEKVFL